ncbi:hypothetical protein [Nibribacter koreensis]|uniref:Lipoprotein n=1 Tax=Nibribacter koreensis TaxID=1084519 RepID=A0ABP8FD91_9BACT
MRVSAFLCCVCIATLGCQSKETAEVGVTTANPGPEELEQTIDSANNSRQDGTVATVSPAQDVKQHLPPELEVVLDQTHPLWQWPSLSDLDRARLTQDQQGPYFLQKDLTGDKKVDYVVQLAEGDSVKVVAFMRPRQEGASWQETTLARKKVGSNQSGYVLSLPEENLNDSGNFKASKVIPPGILLYEGKNQTLHSWQNRKWTQKVMPPAN